jgi:probable HAF family extracellular repeat protein
MLAKSSRCVLTLILPLALSLPVAAQVHSGQQATTPSYFIINLGDPLGGAFSQGTSINDLGWVAGSALLKDGVNQHAELWFYGYPLDLGTVGGASSTVVFPGINNLGEVVGISETDEVDPLGESKSWSCSAFIPPDGNTCVGFVWRFGKMQKLPTLGGNNGFAAGVNDLGQVVGWAETTVHDSTCVFPQVLQFKGVLWSPNGEPEELPSYHGDPDQAAVAINNNGQVVGVSGICGGAVGALSAKHALLWDHGTITDLGNLGTTGGWNTPDAINDQGVVVGFTSITTDPTSPVFHAFVWTKELGREVDLGVLSEDVNSEALSVNNQGEIVGVSFGKSSHAVVWINNVPNDMNGFHLTGAPLTLTAANAVNDRGVITGTANDAQGNVVTFVAIPSH